MDISNSIKRRSLWNNGFMADTRVEQRVGQVKKYVEKNRGWRPRRRTIIYLCVTIGAMVLAAIVVPRVLPGMINNSQSLLGRGPAIEVVPLSGGAYHQYIPGPPAGEGYSSWSMSESREEVVVGWFHESAGKVDKVSVQSRSSYSGRLQVEWQLPAEGNDPKVVQVGFLPRHNQIWFLASGRLHMIDIKSGAILDFPYKSATGSGDINAPAAIGYAGFSPKTGKLAYLRSGELHLVTGLGTGRDGKPLGTQVILLPGATRDFHGQVVNGRVDFFAWITDDLIAVIVRQGSGTSSATSIYYVNVAGSAPAVELKVPAPEEARFVSISESPALPEYAVLVASSPGGKAAFSVRVYDISGKLKDQFRLPAGEWRPPLSWDSP
jgi:hypothetical protein